VRFQAVAQRSRKGPFSVDTCSRVVVEPILPSVPIRTTVFWDTGVRSIPLFN